MIAAWRVSGSTNVYCMRALYPCTNELAIEKHAQQITSMQEVLIKSGNNLQRKLHNVWHQKVNYLQNSALLALHTNCSDPLSKMILLSIFSFYGYYGYKLLTETESKACLQCWLEQLLVTVLNYIGAESKFEHILLRALHDIQTCTEGPVDPCMLLSSSSEWYRLDKSVCLSLHG